MSKKQGKQPKCKITEEQLQKRFNVADVNGDGTLSAEQITSLLKSLGYEDTYKGTIKKLCRKMDKLSKLKKENELTEQNSKQQKQPQKQSDKSKVKAKDATGQQDQATEQQAEQQPRITFQQFKQYFQILQKPIGKILYKMQLQRKISAGTLSKTIEQKGTYKKDKGQRIKANILVGQQKESYNSSIDLKVFKKSQNKSNQYKFFLQVSIPTNSQKNAQELKQILKATYQMVIQMIVSQNQEYEEIRQIISLEAKSQGSIAKIKLSTDDQNLNKLIQSYISTADQILKTEVKFFLRILIQFDFVLQQLKNDPNAIIQDIITKNSNILFQYEGSQFMDAVKQMAIGTKAFQIMQIDPNNLSMIFLRSFLSMEKADFFFKLKNLEKTKAAKQMTEMLYQSLQILSQIQTQQFSFKRFSQIVQGPILMNIQAKNAELHLNINIKDVLKLPFYLQRAGVESENESD